MPSLAQLLAQHERILVLDAASTEVHLGLLGGGQEPMWHHSSDEAGKALFQLLEDCLRAADLPLDSISAFVYCDGPGSMLGVRTVVMAIRTWQALQPRPAYRYHSLTLLAHDLLTSGRASAPCGVIADARRDHWHVTPSNAQDGVGALERVPKEKLHDGALPLWHSTAFRAWNPVPSAAQDVPYLPAQLFASQCDTDLLERTEMPDVFQHAAPEYKKWSAQIHRAPTTTES
ncbi:MAG: hypothetical protein Q8M02_08350 [Candidatus Didemnitutus sp.]|nr:hypothetical protein [Candidatus Didemnitutus sp.]